MNRNLVKFPTNNIGPSFAGSGLKIEYKATPKLSATVAINPGECQSAGCTEEPEERRPSFLVRDDQSLISATRTYNVVARTHFARGVQTRHNSPVKPLPLERLLFGKKVRMN